ncbi:MAG TPA: amidohydrolase family protein [Gemmatimonadaceae bacterium]|nr:amidohydrolase family protein [Gemmatimonadaceae bacterium]
MSRTSVRRIARVFALCLLAAPPAVAQRYALVNGRWFDGRRFVARTLYVERGTFTSRRPAAVDSTIDLAGRFVVPPFGEAHNHNIEGAPAATVKAYLDAGIFYVKDPCSFPEAKRNAVGTLNTPLTVDAVFAGGCITGPDGHPVGLARRNIARGTWKADDGDGRFLHAVADSADFERRWPAILRAGPDFIKTILVYSEEHARRRDDPRFVNWHGLDPALLPLVVRRAHSAGLRVSSHIESAADFHRALTAGVDEINHLPGFRPEGDSVGGYRGDLARYRIAPADARYAARNGVVVVTTIGEILDYLAMGDSSGLDAPARARVRALHAANLRLLRSSGVRVVLGSDRFRSNTVSEALALRSLGVFSDAELLAMWSMATPRAIFPGRRVGCLDAGCEASFLALHGDPLADFANVGRIALRMKQGVLLR